MSATGNYNTNRREKNKERMMQQSQIYQMFAELKNELITTIESGNADRDAKIDQHAVQVANIQQAVHALENSKNNSIIRVKNLEEHENELLQKVQRLEGNGKIDQQKVQLTNIQQAVDALETTEKNTMIRLNILEKHEKELLQKVQTLEGNLEEQCKKINDFHERERRQSYNMGLTVGLQAFFFIALKRLKK